MFTIEKDVPVISNKRGRKPTAFPLGDMEVGDSFLIPIVEEDEKELTKKIESWRRKFRVASKAFLKEYEAKFSTAVVDGGLRVYRTE